MAKRPTPKKAAPPPPPAKGRPSQFSDEHIAAIKERYLLGDSPADIARDYQWKDSAQEGPIGGDGAGRGFAVPGFMVRLRRRAGLLL
jgi:hypothetical protein